MEQRQKLILFVVDGSVWIVLVQRVGRIILVEKKEGATQTCSKCRTDLICKKITSTWNNKTEEKLQWQNKSDGNPHFKFAGPGKYDCNVPKDDESQEVQTIESTVTTNTFDGTSSALTLTDGATFTSPTTIEPEIPQMDQVTEVYVDKQLILIQQIEKRVFEVLGANANVAKVGMYVKLILEGINRK